MTYRKFSWLILASGLILLGSCKKEPVKPTPPSQESEINDNNEAPTGYTGDGAEEWD